MNLKQLEFAVALAEEGNFTRAAQRCHVVQSALSHQIAHLEDELQATLFERLPRQVRVTPAGEALLTHARQVLASLRHLRDDVAAVGGQVRGILHIGQITSLTAVDLVACLAAFHQRYPQVEFRLRMDKSEVLMADVRERRLDVALVGLSPGTPIEGAQHRLLAEEAMVAVLPPAHPLATRRRLSLATLAELPLVDFPQGSGARRQTDEAFAAAGLPHRVPFEINHMALVERFVQQGLAVGIVPQAIAAGFSGVACVAIQGAPTRRVHAVWSNLPTPAARAFMAELLQHVAPAPEPRTKASLRRRARAGSGP
ncbi:LysR family transcriptional regulator [Stenotrophomonas sp. TWI273]|uniref:LysR family transcriptional regulator n=1 Tax=Stenotrophomonas sp. TWI273 TaxID=3136774 RepID=UPI0032086F83